MAKHKQPTFTPSQENIDHELAISARVMGAVDRLLGDMERRTFVRVMGASELKAETCATPKA